LILNLTSRTNPLVKTYRKKKREIPNESRSVLIEGIRLLEEGVKSNVEFEAVFFLSKMESQPRSKELVAHLADKTKKIFRVTQEVMEALSLEKTPPGILAWISVPEKVFSIDIKKSPLLILCDLQDPGNVGSLFRIAEGAGFSVWLSEKSAHPLHPKVVKASMGSIFRVPFQRGNIVELLQHFKKNGVSIVGTRTSNGIPYDAWNWRFPTAVLLGGEAHGIPKNLESYIDAWVSIPLKGKVESLNASAAGAVILFEASRKMQFS
jgi:TrmH family RNA methyltransferase